MKTAHTLLKSWLILTVALGYTSATKATTLTHNAWGSNYSVNCAGNDALQFNATRSPGDGAGSLTPGNWFVLLEDVTYWYPNYPCYESTTWTSNGTGRKAAKVSGAYENPYPTSAADYYLPADRFLKLRNLTIDNVDLDYDNLALWFFTSGAVTPAPDMSLTLKNGSITGFNPPLAFDSRAKFNLSATGDSSILNWWIKINVQSPTTMNVTGAGSRLRFYRVGKYHSSYHDALYFSNTNNTALIDGATLKLEQSSLTFGDPHPGNDQYGKMTFQNNATLELAGPETKLESGNVFFTNSSLKLGLGVTKLIVDGRLTFNGASADIAGTAKVTAEAFDVFGSNTIALPKEYSEADYTVMAGTVLMRPDSSLTLSGEGSLASSFQLLWSHPDPVPQWGQIVINDNANLVNDGGIFIVNPAARITINRTNGNVFGSLIVKNSGVTELHGSSSYYANVINQGQISALSNGALAVTSTTFNILGGNQGLISIESEGRLDVGNFGTAPGATAVLNTDNSVFLDSFSTLKLTIDPTARKNSQLRTSGELTISNFAHLNLGLVNDQVLPVGTKFVLIDYASLRGVAVNSNVVTYFNGYRDGSSFVLGLNRYQINYKDSGDAGFAGAVTLTVIPLVPPVAALSPSPQTVSGTVGASITPSATLVPSNFGGTVTYSINPGLPPGLKFDLVRGVISGVSSQALTATVFTIRGVGSTSGDANATVNLTIAKANQTISFGPAPAPTYSPGGVFQVSASASSSLPITYSSLTPLVCTAGSSSVNVVSAGTCTIAANQAGNANYNAAPQATQTIAIAKANPPALVLSATPASIGVGANSALATSGGGTGAITFTLASGPCSLAGGTLTGTGVGACVVTASQAADTNYNAINANAATVTVTLVPQAALVLTATPATISANAASALGTTGGNGTGVVTYAVTSGSCTLAGTTLTSSVGGSCTVVATKAADGIYGVASSSPVAITVNRLDQGLLSLVANPASLNVNGTSALSTHGGNGTGAVTFSVANGPCTVSGSTLTATGAGNCVVTASKAADNTYNAATSAPVTMTISLAPQAALILTASPGSISVGGTSTLGTTGGSGTGAVAYALTSGPCTVSGNILTGTGSGSCIVTATKAATSAFAAATSNPVSVPVALTPQASLVLSAASTSINVGGTTTLSTSGGNGGGAVTYSVNDGPCTITGGNILNATGQGQCHVTATRAGDATFGAATSNTITITVSLAPQAGLVLTASPTAINAKGTSTLGTTGGNGTGAVTYAVTSGACTVSGTALTSSVAGSCTVVATKAADATYGAATSNAVTVNVSASTQTPLVLTASPSSIGVNGISTLSTSGGDGTGAVIYNVIGGSCTISGNLLTGTSTGNCTVTATKAATSTYGAVTSAPVTVTVVTGTQTNLVLTASPTSINVNSASTLSTSGGQGTGAVTYALNSGPCTLSGSTLRGTALGQCQVVATKAADGNYGAATSNPVTVTVNLLTPPALVLGASPASVGFGGSSTLSTSGGISGGAVTYSVSGPCYVTGNTLTGTSTGACLVIATQAATSAYSSATSNTVTVTVRERSTAFSYPRATATIGLPFTLTPTLGGFTNPTFAVLYGTLPAGLTLNAQTGVISGTPIGPIGTGDFVISAFENNAYDAALVVIDVQAGLSSQGIPTLSEWGQLILASLLAIFAGWHMRRGGRRL